MWAPMRPPIRVTVTGVVTVVMGAPWRCVRVRFRSGRGTGAGKAAAGAGVVKGCATGMAGRVGDAALRPGGGTAGRGAQARRGAGQRP